MGFQEGCLVKQPGRPVPVDLAIYGRSAGIDAQVGARTHGLVVFQRRGFTAAAGYALIEQVRSGVENIEDVGVQTKQSLDERRACGQVASA